MSDTSSRLRPLLSVLQTPREWPGGELAGRLRVSARTIRRDIDRLREPGADALEWSAARLLLPGCEFEAHERPESRRYPRELAARAGRAAAG
jgi:predicted DNA-binding transcriptional regulator YafY